MPFFSASGNEPSNTATSASTPSAIEIPNSSTNSASPSFFSSAFGSFFGSSPSDSSPSSRSRDPTRRARSLSRSRYTPSITADEAMNLSRATTNTHHSHSNSSSRTAFDEKEEIEYYQSPRSHHNYGRFDGGSLSRVVSAEPDFAGSTDSVTGSTIHTSQTNTTTSTKHSTTSTLNRLKQQTPTLNTAQLHQKLANSSRQADNSSGSDHSLHSSNKTPARRSSLSAAMAANKLRRNSSSGAKYQGIGLVAAYDQGGIL